MKRRRGSRRDRRRDQRGDQRSKEEMARVQKSQTERDSAIEVDEHYKRGVLYGEHLLSLISASSADLDEALLTQALSFVQ